MKLNDVTFIKGQGGLGRPLPGNDHISGMIFFTDALTAGIRKLFSKDDAENLGINYDYSDETKATGGSIKVTHVPTEGEIITTIYAGVILCKYVATAADTTVALLAASLGAAINNSKVLTAEVTTDTVALALPAGLGAAADGYVLTCTTSGTATFTIVQFTGGVSSFKEFIRYHIDGYFTIQPKGVLYLGISPEITYSGAEIEILQLFAGGIIRQVGVMINDETLAGSHVTLTNGICASLEGKHMPLSAVIAANLKGETLSSLVDLTTKSSGFVSVNISDDGNFLMPVFSETENYLVGDKVTALGKVFKCKTAGSGSSPLTSNNWVYICENLRDKHDFSISTMGTELGTVSLSRVFECIAWVGKFNVVDGDKLDVPAFSTGEFYAAVNDNLKDDLNGKHYNFLRKHIGYDGTFFNDSWTAIAETSDYCTIENNRTINKAMRNIRVSLMPNLASPLYVTADGKLNEPTIAIFKNQALQPLEQMVTEGELSACDVIIDPNQNVLATSKIVVVAKLVPVGVAREILVPIGFTIKIS